MDMQTPDLESLVSQDYDRSHPGDSFADLRRRARFTKEDKDGTGKIAKPKPRAKRNPPEIQPVPAKPKS